MMDCPADLIHVEMSCYMRWVYEGAGSGVHDIITLLGLVSHECSWLRADTFLSVTGATSCPLIINMQTEFVAYLLKIFLTANVKYAMIYYRNCKTFPPIK